MMKATSRAKQVKPRKTRTSASEELALAQAREAAAQAELARRREHWKARLASKDQLIDVQKDHISILQKEVEHLLDELRRYRPTPNAQEVILLN